MPQLSNRSVKTSALGPPRPLSPSIPAVAGRQLAIVRAAAYASDSGESPNSKHWFTTSFRRKVPKKRC